MGDDVQHHECEIGADDARRAARAVVRARMTSPIFVTNILILLVIAGVIATGGIAWLAAVVVLAAVAVALAPLRRTPAVAAALQERGFRPGTRMAVDYGDTGFTVTSPGRTAEHEYASVRSVRMLDDIAAITLKQRGLLVVLPAALVPADVRGRLGRG